MRFEECLQNQFTYLRLASLSICCITLAFASVMRCRSLSSDLSTVGGYPREGTVIRFFARVACSSARAESTARRICNLACATLCVPASDRARLTRRGIMRSSSCARHLASLARSAAIGEGSCETGNSMRLWWRLSLAMFLKELVRLTTSR